MPDGAALSKVAAASALEAEVVLGGGSVDECVDLAWAHAGTVGAAFVPPFDHPHVVAGQGTLGLELLEQVPDLAQVLVPLGGARPAGWPGFLGNWPAPGPTCCRSSMCAMGWSFRWARRESRW